MKTCKDCIYYSGLKNRVNVFDSESWYADCHLYPKVIETSSGYWCGQFKPEIETITTEDVKSYASSYNTPEYLAEQEEKNRRASIRLTKMVQGKHTK